jgi:hypothetical protein
MLLFIFALSAHVQLARYDSVFALPARHILHGDLRPDSDKSGRVLDGAPDATVLAVAVDPLPHTTAPPRLVTSSLSPPAEPSLREILNYLVLFVRPPPLPLHAHC